MKEIIESLRNEIDNIEYEILFLLSKRFEISKMIGKIKKEKNISVFQHDREVFIMKKIKLEAEKYGLSQEISKKIYEVILKQSRKMQSEI